jgi:hypothetical protein
MLSVLFQQEIDRLAQQASSVQAQRAARDAFIVAEFPLLDAAFATLVDTTVGSEPHLTVTHTPATDTFTNHSFVSLAKTISNVRSTLYGTPENVLFTPSLESTQPDEFAVIRITTDGLPQVALENATGIFADMLKRGILMRGKTAASLVAPDGGNFTPLTADLLEGFLAALFIRP